MPASLDSSQVTSPQQSDTCTIDGRSAKTKFDDTTAELFFPIPAEGPSEVARDREPLESAAEVFLVITRLGYGLTCLKPMGVSAFLRNAESPAVIPHQHVLPLIISIACLTIRLVGHGVSVTERVTALLNHHILEACGQIEEKLTGRSKWWTESQRPIGRAAFVLKRGSAPSCSLVARSHILHVELQSSECCDSKKPLRLIAIPLSSPATTPKAGPSAPAVGVTDRPYS